MNSGKEKLWSPALVHVPYKSLLAGVVILILLNQVLEEEQVVSEVVFLLHVCFKSMWIFIEVVFTDATYEAVVLQLFLYTVHLVTKSTKSINDEALYDSQKDECDEQVERKVKDD